VPSPDVRPGQRVALAGIAASAVLATLHVAVGLSVRSMSVLAAGVEFAGDVLASLVVFVGMLAASAPADERHPYGHGRLETIAAFVVGLILTVGGAGISWNSLQAIGEVHPPPTLVAIAVLVVAILVRAALSLVKFRVGRRIRSAALVADGWNDMVDILAATVALIAVGLTIFDVERFRAADHYGGFAVGVIVILVGVRVFRDATLELMDTMPDETEIARIRAAANEVPGVVSVDKTFARKTGLTYHVDIHVEVDPTLTVAASHDIAGRVRRHVRAQVEWVADVLVHIEPARLKDRRVTGEK
jgi:cation diffusion facilitator family transporter